MWTKQTKTKIWVYWRQKHWYTSYPNLSFHIQFCLPFGFLIYNFVCVRQPTSDVRCNSAEHHVYQYSRSSYATATNFLKFNNNSVTQNKENQLCGRCLEIGGNPPTRIWTIAWSRMFGIFVFVDVIILFLFSQSQFITWLGLNQNMENYNYTFSVEVISQQFLYDKGDDYMLLIECGKEAVFLPGDHQEFFMLKWFQAS